MAVPEKARSLEVDGTLVQAWEIAPGAYATRIVGVMTMPVAKFIMVEGDRYFARPGKVGAFFEWTEMSNYTSDSRLSLTRWGMGHLPDAEFHLAFRSRLVGMGVAVANLAMGGVLHQYDSREALESAVRDYLRQAAR